MYTCEKYTKEEVSVGYLIFAVTIFPLEESLNAALGHWKHI